jgi:thiol-disulfide isomerase/thioredoxin
MVRITLSTVFVICVSSWVFAADPPNPDTPAPAPAAAKTIEQQIQEAPDNTALLNQYMMDNARQLMILVNSNPDEAQKRVEAMKQLFDSLQPTQDAAKTQLGRAKSFASFYEQRIQLARTSRAELEAKLTANPEDAPTISLFAQKVLMELSPLVSSETARAEEGLQTAKTFLEGLKAKAQQEAAKKALETADQSLARLQASLDRAKQMAELARTPRADLEAKLNANPDDAQTIALYGQKVLMDLMPLASSETDRADEGLKTAKSFLEGLKAKIKDEAAKKAVDNADQSWSGLQTRIDRAKRLAALVGKDATPLEVEAWVNGTPLTESDLKGKVVLLDFWAVWCGPCIATFPHLREWQEKYADKGLVIVGLTRYYNFTWDDQAGRPMRAQGEEKVAPEKEREMLVKFAEHHNLHHRFALQKDTVLSEYYAVSGIPHVVVIDREGKVRLIRVGSGDQNAQDIQNMLEKLLAAS